jgi:hypothetical protein
MTKEKKYKHFTPRSIEPPKTPEEEAEEIRKDIKLRDWQRKELARRQGFNPDTYMNDDAESEAVETKFNEMLALKMKGTQIACLDCYDKKFAEKIKREGIEVE